MLIQLIFLIISISKCKSQANEFEIFENLLKVVGSIEIPSYQTSNLDQVTFDYVVVGAGSAGSVLGNRLSENPKIRVLVLEAGDSPPRVSEVPFLTPILQESKYNWDYYVEKEDNFGLGLIDQRVRWPRGKVIGGSSTINAMLHTRGNKHDYDRWEAMGNPGWSYKDVLPYFMKSENSSVKFQDSGYHRNDGYLNVQDPQYRTKSARTFIKAAMELGYPYVDYNGKNQMGVSLMQVTLRDGRRCSGEKAFLRPAKDRPNLVISKNSFVTRVLVDGATKTAYGVEYVRKNQTLTVNATKEVILSAGVLRSPQILMLSGIGPREDLKKIKIPMVHDLPVGKKMYDHPVYYGLSFGVNKKIVLLYDKASSLESMLNFTIHDTGPLTSTNTFEGVLFMKTTVAKHKEDYPDVELMFLGSSPHLGKNLVYKRIVGITDEVFGIMSNNFKEKYAWSVWPMLLNPISYGHIELKSTNPFEHVKIYANYFTDPENQDLRTLIAGIRESQRISNAPAFQKYGSNQIKFVYPGCKHLRYDSDDYWECAIRHLTNTGHHQTSTCKMGPANDPEAVVDNKLRVHGIKNLRVVDASVIPIPLSGHTNVPSFMIGEKASDMILEDYVKSTF